LRSSDSAYLALLTYTGSQSEDVLWRNKTKGKSVDLT
jgi:hypothetical protein